MKIPDHLRTVNGKCALIPVLFEVSADDSGSNDVHVGVGAGV